MLTQINFVALKTFMQQSLKTRHCKAIVYAVFNSYIYATVYFCITTFQEFQEYGCVCIEIDTEIHTHLHISDS